MPRTTKKPKPVPQPVLTPLPEVNGPTVEVMTLHEAAAYLRLPEEEVLRLVREQALPARQAGSEWRFFKAAIQQWLSTPALQSNKEAWLSLAGVWKDDPYAEEELKEIYKQRGRPMLEDE